MMDYLFTIYISSVVTCYLISFVVKSFIKRFAIEYVLTSSELEGVLTISNKEAASALVKNSRFFKKLVDNLDRANAVAFKQDANSIAVRIREQLLAED